MVNDAEASKERDLKRRQAIDMKNEADQAIYNTEKQLQEHSAKIPQNVKDQINGDIRALNEAITTEDADKIRDALERLKNSSMEIGKAIYSQSSSDSGSSETKEEEKKDEEKK
jgi:molecular chaperone DnaK